MAEAKAITRRTDTWIALSNTLSNPLGGLIARYFLDAGQRHAFLNSAEYEKLNQLLLLTI